MEGVATTTALQLFAKRRKLARATTSLNDTLKEIPGFLKSIVEKTFSFKIGSEKAAM